MPGTGRSAPQDQAISKQGNPRCHELVLILVT